MQQYLWSEVVAVGDVTPRHAYSSVIGYEFEVQTFKGSVVLKLPRFGRSEVSRLHKEVVGALRLHATGQKDIRSVTLSLRLDEQT